MTTLLKNGMQKTQFGNQLEITDKFLNIKINDDGLCFDIFLFIFTYFTFKMNKYTFKSIKYEDMQKKQ